MSMNSENYALLLNSYGGKESGRRSNLLEIFLIEI